MTVSVTALALGALAFGLLCFTLGWSCRPLDGKSRSTGPAPHPPPHGVEDPDAEPQDFED